MSWDRLMYEDEYTEYVLLEIEEEYAKVLPRDDYPSENGGLPGG